MWLNILLSRWTHYAVLLLACAALAALWRLEHGRVATVAAACELAQQEAVNAALREQAKGWETVYSAQQEAVARMAQEAGVAAANAREWQRRYNVAKQTPACKAWSEATVQCPVD